MDPSPNPSSDETSSDHPEVLNYASPVTVTAKLVNLRLMGVMEGELAKTKLESEGINCFLSGRELHSANPLLFNDVQLQVAEPDLEVARQILDRPAPADAESEYADEPWRCPKCHRKSVDLLPLAPRMKLLRYLWLLLLATPLMLSVITALIGDRSATRSIEQFRQIALGPWLIVIFAITLMMFQDKRRKHCRDCGHEWNTGDEQSD